jgi:hypothetical protein
MTKFDRSGKIGPFGFLFRNIRFWLVQRRFKTRAKHEDLRYFEAWKKAKRCQGTKLEEVQAKSQMSQKLDCPILDTGVFSFSRRDTIQLGFDS